VTLLDTLPLFHYGAIMADPPWSFDNYSAAGEEKNAKAHYGCMSTDAIARMPVGQLAAPDCALFLWVTDPLLPEGIEVMRRWGFRFVTVAFTWVKRTATGKAFYGCGYWTRANPEMCLMGTVGRPKRLSAAVPQLLEAEIREHSRKPEEARHRVEKLVGGPYLELFSRTNRPGWTCWGNEAGKFDQEGT
jgi:N6-adenosine-specific RNA methylase IME4